VLLSGAVLKLSPFTLKLACAEALKGADWYRQLCSLLSVEQVGESAALSGVTPVYSTVTLKSITPRGAAMLWATPQKALRGIVLHHAA